jgi:hypothetical protein
MFKQLKAQLKVNGKRGRCCFSDLRSFWAACSDFAHGSLQTLFENLIILQNQFPPIYRPTQRRGPHEKELPNLGT